MDPLTANPFAVFTFIVAPAVLTNASSVMGQQTANRFARAIDRARSLAKEVRGHENDADPETALRVRQLASAERRALLLVRALTAFYGAVGAFAAASRAALFGAVAVTAGSIALRDVALWVALAGGATGVGGLIAGPGCSCSRRAWRWRSCARKPTCSAGAVPGAPPGTDAPVRWHGARSRPLSYPRG